MSQLKAAAFLPLLVLLAAAAPVPQTGVADLVDGEGNAKGKAVLTQQEDGIHVDLKVSGLPSGVHAAHIHSVGACTAPDFKSAGGHWNPEMKQHGRENPMGAHMGDMPNMTVSDDGAGTLETVVEGATLTDGKDALFDADGAAIVIHAIADDNKSDPSGNAGGRIACGVIKAE